MIPGPATGGRRSARPQPPSGAPDDRGGNSRGRPEGDHHRPDNGGEFPQAAGTLELEDEDEKKKKKKKKGLIFLPKFWSGTDLSTLPELVGKPGSGVYQALQNGKDLELRSTRETLYWPDGHLSSLRDTQPGDLITYAEYDPACNLDRRLVLRVGTGGTAPLGTSVYASRGAAVAAGGERVCPPSLVAHLQATGASTGATPLSEAWGTATYSKAGFGSGACFLLEVAPVGLMTARSTDLRPSNKSPTKKLPRQGSRSPEATGADRAPPKARKSLGLDLGSATVLDPIGLLAEDIGRRAEDLRASAAAKSPQGTADGTIDGGEAEKGGVDCSVCGLELKNDRELKKHLKGDHDPGVNKQELADMAFAPCPVPGCDTIHSLKGGSVGVTPFYRHLQQYSNKPELDGHVDHLNHMQSADGGTSGELYLEAADACRARAQDGTAGSRLNVKKARSRSPTARPKPSPTAALPPTVKPTPKPPRAPLKGSSRASSTAPTRCGRPVGALDVTHAGIDTVDSEDDETQDDEPAVKITAKETTPREDYDVAAFKDVDLDRLKGASLYHQEPPKSTEAAGAVMQPMVFAWNALSRRLTKAEQASFHLPKSPFGFKWTAAATEEGLAALKMYYVAHAVLLCRPRGTDPYTVDEMLVRAKTAASSAEALLSLYEDLMTATEATTLPQAKESDRAVEVPQASRHIYHIRSRRLARLGEWRRAAQALVPTKIAPPSSREVRVQYAALNPEHGAKAFGGELTDELMADVPGQRPFQPTMETFEAVMDHPPRARAAGMLHDTFEVLSAVYRHGGKGAMFHFFAAFCAGMVQDDLADLITDLRAVCFWKDADCTKIRPIGIGEALRRRICACIARQDREVWDQFCTTLLPEDQHARDGLIAECDEIVDGLKKAIDSGAASGAPNAEAKAKLVVALSELETAKAPTEFPVNYSFSKNSAEMTFHHVQSWVDQFPKDHTISDDKKQMFPTALRPQRFLRTSSCARTTSLRDMYRRSGSCMASPHVFSSSAERANSACPGFTALMPTPATATTPALREARSWVTSRSQVPARPAMTTCSSRRRWRPSSKRRFGDGADGTRAACCRYSHQSTHTTWPVMRWSRNGPVCGSQPL